MSELQKFKNKITEEYGSINVYCQKNSDTLDSLGISRATVYGFLTGNIKNPTVKNLKAFSELSGVPLEEVTNVFVFGYRDPKPED